MPAKNVPVRILADTIVHGIKYLCNEVVLFEKKLADSLERAGHVDSDGDAVAYATAQLGAEPKEHVVPDPAVANANAGPDAGAAADAQVSAQGASEAAKAADDSAQAAAASAAAGGVTQ